ncbi:hybrid non-ribosomal peptide synthetase/type I polyketide synthase [Bacillus sp. MBGLi79]|uniref:hybrid non-ribosomal peptide synthetase/type I polyketide synthase n=1 Tax=Bacillus sp. MBGLi79 TaxID=2070759 RepID=UPI000CDAC9E4|nr:hybrid non-ribosomal peptide synthetase/type I polyketide synthase [Bacillus sp. MBGLi79]AUZ37550.1 non-ribosomal peptide synthetase [Bacillus sp. MBGLi79]POO79001.1 non-ribosomal peptide synthetase [Bacillus sp. MBGLi97]
MSEQMKKIDKNNIANILGLTTIQEGLLFHHLMEPEGNAYFEQMLIKLESEPARDLFEKAWQQTVQQNEMLRTVFRWKETAKPIQVILKHHNIDIRYQSIPFEKGISQDKLKEELAARDRREPFQLQEVPFRVTLYQTEENGIWMMISFHHILMDGWSMGIVLKEWMESYQALSMGQTPVVSQKPSYQAFVKWQQEQQRKTKDSQALFWKGLLKDWEPVQLLPNTERPGKRNAIFSKHEIQLPVSAGKALRSLAAERQVTLASILYSVWGLLLKKYSDQEEVVFGTTVSGRSADVPGIEQMTGLFINTIPLRLRFAPQSTPLDVIQLAHEQIAKRSEYEHTPLSDLKTYAGLTAEQSLFDTIVVIENYPLDQMLKSNSLPLSIEQYDMFEQTEFDLTLSVQAFDEHIHFSFIYNPGAMSALQVKQLGDHFLNLLSEVIDNPADRSVHRLNMLSEDEVHYQLEEFCNYKGMSGNEHQTVIDLFERQTAKTPDALAVEFRSESLTYDQLNKKVNQLARFLEGQGVRPAQRVGILTEHSIEMVIACLAVLKAGGAYVPVDPDYPAERIEYLLQDSGINLLLTEDIDGLVYSYDGVKIDITDQNLYQGNDSNLVKQYGSQDIAYCIYTSGTTGRPKGVLVKHLGLENYVSWAAEQYVRGHKRDFALYTSLSFDLTVTSIFTPLITGNAIIVYQDKNKQLLVEQILKDNRAHVMKLTPSHLHFISEMPFQDSVMECLILGGEQLETSLAAKIEQNFDGKIEIFNEYGPTETVVGCMIHRYSSEMDKDLYVPIGRPAAHTDIYILDSHMNLLPRGAAGELYIAGKGVAEGYLGRKELTAERFVAHPFKPGEKMYKTGDAARFLPDGTIQFLGRNDDQIKLRGYRIESGEIEHWLCRYGRIKGAAAVVKKDASQTPCLAAYLFTDETIDEKQLREYLRRHLPEYMIPSRFIVMDEMPLTANGKLDKKALPELAAETKRKVLTEAPASETEKMVLEVWKRVLGQDSINVHDKFFEIGGTSLHLIQVNQQLSKETGKSIPMVEMFRRPTVQLLAEFLSGQDEGQSKKKAPFISKRKAPSNDSIAIIGMAGRFPGAKNIDEFWHNLKNGKESISFFTDEELFAAGIDEQTFTRGDYVRAKGIIDGPDLFDASFFGYSPGQAEVMDPQIRLLHEYVWKTVEDAGCVSAEYEGKIGLFTGTTSNFQWLQHFADSLDGRMSELFEIGSLNDTYTISTRVAHKLNLKGPAITLQTACSTSLVALHLACKSVLNGESDIALAGGVSILHPVKSGYIYQENMVKSPDGHCRAFDKDAKGTVGGDGVGFVAVKSLSRALADGDRIYAVVKGSAVNNDGDQKVGFNAPSVEGQTEVIREAIADAGIEPETISYVETHGTGTALGDPIEIEALTKAFQTNKTAFCRIGSVKTNIGHLDAAAGAAGLIKTVLSLKHQQLVPSLHFKEANPNIDFENSPFLVNDTLRTWKKTNAPRRAGVSSFGMGGTNAHVILEEAPVSEREKHTRSYQLFPLSAKTMNALEKTKDLLLEHMETNSELNAADAAYTLQAGRQHFDYRQMFVAKDRQDVIRLLSEKKDRGLSRMSRIQEKKEKKLIFMFTGQGSQYVNMGRDLYTEEPFFKETMDHCFQEFYEATGERLENILYPDQQDEDAAAIKLQETKYAQPAIFMLEYALSLLLMKWGLRPWAMIGYSFGELTAAAVSGVFTLSDAIKLISLRGQAMHEAPSGIMLSVPMPEEELKAILPDCISLAVVNDASCIVSGLESDISAFEEQLKAKKVLCMRVKGSIAAHSHVMASAAERFGNTAKHISYQKPGVPFFSNLTGDWIADEEAADYDYWKRHMTETVRFAEGIGVLTKQEHAIFIEIGPGQDLSVLVKRSINDEMRQHVCNVLKHSRQNMSDVQFLLSRIGTLWMYGAVIDWRGLHEGRNPEKITMPQYPFEKESFWPKRKHTASGKGNKHSGGKLPLQEWFYLPQWEKEILPISREIEAAEQRLLVFMEDGDFSHKLIQGLQSACASCVIVKKGHNFQQVEKGVYTLRPDSAEDYCRLFEVLEKEKIQYSRILHLWGLAEKNETAAAEWIEQIQNESYYSLLYLGQALKKKGTNQEISIFVLSSLTYQLGGEETLYPEKAVHLGPSMVISQETPFLRYRVIDIDRQKEDSWKEDKLLGLIRSELMTESGNLLTVYRNNKRYTRNFIHKAVPAESSQGHLRPGGVYILIGGLGFIGLHAAKTIAEKTKGKLILTSRSGLPPRSEWESLISTHAEDDPTVKKIKSIYEIEQTGAEVIAVAADASCEADMSELVHAAEHKYGSIHGVIYAAGITGEQSFRMMEQTDRSFSNAHIQAKMTGVAVLEKVLDDRPLDFCFLISSLSPILGGLGFTAYTAVNHFVDAFVYQHNAQHPVQWTALNLDGWEFEDGKKPDIPVGGDLENTLIRAHEGREVFERIFTFDHMDQIVVSATDLQERIQKYVNRLHQPSDEQQEEDVSLYGRPELTAEYVEPVTEMEKELLVHWQSFFKIDQIGIDDDFFEMGGDSLKAITFISILHQAFNVEIALPDFFNIPTIRQMAEFISQADKKIYRKIEKAEKQDYYPLSSAQKRLYLVQQLDQTSTGYNEFTAGRIAGKLDMQRLENAFRQLIHRHESLRTSFKAIDGVPMQCIAEHAEFHADFFDLSHLAGQEGQNEKEQEVISSFLKPFQLDQAPLMRAGVMKNSENEYILMLDMHHIISDGLSQDILVSEFMDLYDGKELAPLELQYKDFSEWQNQMLQSDDLNEVKTYWLKRLDGFRELQLPADYRRPDVKSFAGAHYRFDVSKKELEAFKAIMADEDATLFMGLLSIYQVLLHKLTGQSDIVVGVPVAGRRQEELQRIIGIFVNMLPLRFYPKKEMTFTQFLHHVKQLVIDDFDHQDYQYEHMVQDLKLDRTLNRNHIFDTVFALQNLSQPSLEVDGITLTDYEYETAVSRFDLLWIASEDENGLSSVIEYSTELFTRETIEGIAKGIKKVLSAVIDCKQTALKDIDLTSGINDLEKVSLLELDDLKI